jgi:hypothetical protein
LRCALEKNVVQKPEILSSLSDEEYSLVRDFHADAWAAKDQRPRALSMWVVKGERNAAFLASRFAVAEPVVAALFALAGALEGNHVLRWVRQMALRGKGRVFDEYGVCGEQKVVITGGKGSLERLCLHKDKLFPGASLTVSRPGGVLWGETQVERLLVSLSDPTLPDAVPATHVGKLMDIDWRDNSIEMGGDDTKAMLKTLGWTYESRPGRSGSLFRRIPSVNLSSTQAV